MCSSDLVIGGNNDALVDAANRSYDEILEENLFLCVVDVPNANSVVVNRDHVVIGLVVEGDLVGNVHAYSVATDGISTLCLI